MALSSAMDTAAQGPTLRAFYAIQIALPSNTINLIDGSGVVTFTVNTVSTQFTSFDATFGTMMSLSAVEESLATSAPHLQITLGVPTTSAIATLNAINAQLSPVLVFYGFVSDTLGTVIGTPELIFSGYLDTVNTTSDMNSRQCVLDIASGWERLFIPSEGERLSDVAHQAIYPGEDGLSQAVAAVIVNPIWGAVAVNPITTPGIITPGFSGGDTAGIGTFTGAGGGFTITGPFNS